jgi:D-glycero-D-manno-heptose 1,7-bisphosphate phosphatase
MRPAVFLDRDGTILDELGYLTPDAALTIYPWSLDAIRLLGRGGYAIVIVTNQGGIARGLYTREFVEETHRRLGERFRAAGAIVDGWYFCPHHSEALVAEFSGPCTCQKPAPGMALDAARTLGLDLQRSWVIGDQWRDIALGHAVGSRTVLVHTGHGRSQDANWPSDVARPTMTADTLIAAAAAILG